MFDAIVDALGPSDTTETEARPDGGTVGRRESQSEGDVVDVDASQLDAVFEVSDAAAVGRRQVDRQFALDRSDVADLVAEYDQVGASRSAFLTTQELVTESLVEDAFERLRKEVGPDAQNSIDAVERELRERLETAQFVSRTGIEAFEADGDGDAASEATDRFDYHDVLHHVGTPLFVLDPDGEILTWNRSLEDLTGVSETDAKEMEMASMAFYPDGRRGKTLADKVLDAPERTHLEYDVPKVEDAGFTLYRDRSVMADQHGSERHISFSAAPIYDGDELVAVVEMVQDRTEEAERHEAIETLVEEVESTMGALQRGQLDARASFTEDDGKEHVDDQLCEVVESLNEMAEQVERLTHKVDDQAQALASTIEQTTNAAEAVEERVEKQATSLTTAADTVQEIGAGMEEVAATSSEVASAAQRARDAAEEGSDAGQAVKAVTDNLTETSEDLVDSVTDLESQMDEVNEIVDIIADVAEQTNMLALNANIEAARAGESGSGFAVVANEVKSLANETSDHASDISASIDAIQEQAAETADMVDHSHERVQRAESEIDEALTALDEITEAVEEATSGIQEVADANDDQATAIENITSIVEEAREHAQEAETATGQIVSATHQQQTAVDELTDRVDELTSR
ncbi:MULTISPECIES: methyl-accepting chemotaxis protein [Halomicrobium]|uniref:Methyl-accepting chemotaxis sensory transducer with Pas/Pac sensor n=2 Tax=Halomicrobium mukohataei TaxID=57705 RepID=C7P447_HALMD|nr:MULTISPECIES: methyl-accepting chemotaxis protein [Halomicrobium]ACV47869.1 methyl-accepting chemotaxis sensory transducer with Pas/Pac sensor [Halomicrobium mukohataei DSM 12286]QCD66310.1 PAS domain-containing protein [Halomicrobium mukohataei]QFR21116.1 PAS domain-containing protein [Halomicrobium sp. ZPS1]